MKVFIVYTMDYDSYRETEMFNLVGVLEGDSEQVAEFIRRIPKVQVLEAETISLDENKEAE